jgi:hypothetical protein
VRRLSCALLVSLVVVLGAPRAAAEGAWSAPVDEPVVDPFRPPATPYGPGNRGVDYDTAPGEDVRAAAGGDVVFAGRVGRSAHVVVLHPDGLRTSYSFLDEVLVRRGDHVDRGDVVGRAGDELHFGVRAGDTYLDPMALLEGDPPAVHLVPVQGSVHDERQGLLRSLGGAVRGAVHAGVAGVAWAKDQVGEQVALQLARLEAEVGAVRTLLTVAQHYRRWPQRLVAYARAVERYRASQRDCTPGSTAPRKERRRHLVVLVGGLGSAGGRAAVLDVDTKALGYADGDVAQFSYRGGQAPGDRTIDGIPVHGYTAEDSNGDVEAAGDRLRQLLWDLRRTHPGVPVDVIAHSQGGLVVQAAFGGSLELDPRLPTVDHVITLGTPHDGAVLATADAGIGTSTSGRLAQEGIGAVSGGRLDPTSDAVADLSEMSGFVRSLDERPWPDDVRVTAIAASGDGIVPPAVATQAGATNVLVPVTGATAHDRLPGAPSTGRELALALGDQRPACRTVWRGMAGGLLTTAVESAVGGALFVFGQYVDRRVGAAVHPEVPGGAPPR